LARTSLHVEDFAKLNDISTMLQLVQDMRKWIISFEIKRVTSTSSLSETYAQTILRNQNNNFHLKAILSRTWCNFCEENHNENTCEIKLSTRESVFDKKIDTTIDALYWAHEEDFMMVDTQNKYYENKGKGGPPKTTFSHNSSSQQTNPQVTRGTQSQ
jgi:hypothetical protein